MTGLRRDVVKYVRDKAKSKYRKGFECHICEVRENLDFHHYYSLTLLLNKWMRAKKLSPEDILDFRDEFIYEHHDKLYEEVVTICHSHHLQLHSVYGKNPGLGTAMKQKRWIEIQREKHVTN